MRSLSLERGTTTRVHASFWENITRRLVIQMATSPGICHPNVEGSRDIGHDVDVVGIHGDVGPSLEMLRCGFSMTFSNVFVQ